MKILIQCPGSFVHRGVFLGLNSPERGEGRWSQNFAHMLHMAGHDVYAASGGLGNETKLHRNVKLIDQERCKKHGPFDLYIDAAWWQGKEPKASATKYVALKWSLEGYLREEPWADNFFLAYPYPSHRHKFANFKHSDRTFALPTMFGTEFRPPNWGASKVFLPGKIALDRDYKAYMPAIIDLLKKHPLVGCSASFFKEHLGPHMDLSKEGTDLFETASYERILLAMDSSRISFPILNPGCIIEATFRGVPSVMWEHGGFFNSIAQLLDVNVPHGAPPERLTEVAESLMNDKKKHAEAVLGLQSFFAPHLYTEALKYFNLMVESIF